LKKPRPPRKPRTPIQVSSSFDFVGGATIIIDPNGEIRYVISKRVTNDERVASQRAYIAGDRHRFWQAAGGGLN
jgi:hypothetical protein